MIYHITTREAWQMAQSQGSYRAESLQSEGFIHCSARRQVPQVANSFYRGADELLLLQIDESRLNAPLMWEAPAHPDPRQSRRIRRPGQVPAHLRRAQSGCGCRVRDPARGERRLRIRVIDASDFGAVVPQRPLLLAVIGNPAGLLLPLVRPVRPVYARDNRRSRQIDQRFRAPSSASAPPASS